MQASSSALTTTGPSRRRKRLIVCCDGTHFPSMMVPWSTKSERHGIRFIATNISNEGTWLDSSTTLQDHKIPMPSNVTRISRAIKNKSADGIPQVVYYQAGVGSTGNIINRVIGGATAEGLSENIREGYAFLANNYSMGDEIFLFGFSRGGNIQTLVKIQKEFFFSSANRSEAFTARSIAGMVGDIGLLTKSGLPYLAEVFLDFENRLNPRYRPAYRNIPFPNKPSASDPLYREELERVR